MGRVVAYAETGQSGVAEIAPSWSPSVYRFRGADQHFRLHDLLRYNLMTVRAYLLKEA